MKLSFSRTCYLVIFLFFTISLSASGMPRYPFIFEASISPDKRYYEAGDIVTFEGILRYDKTDPWYNSKAIYDIISLNKVGKIGNNIITASTIGDTIRADSTFTEIPINVVYEIKELTKRVILNIGIYEYRYNYGFADTIVNEGLDPEYPQNIWRLNHMSYPDNRLIMNTNPYIAKDQKKKNQKSISNDNYNSDLYTWKTENPIQKKQERVIVEPEIPFEVNITPKKRKYKIGKPIIVKVEFTYTGDDTLRFYKHDRNYTEWSSANVYKEINETEIYKIKPFPKMALISPNADDWIYLKEGDKYKLNIEINKNFYDYNGEEIFNSTGIYFFSIDFRDRMAILNGDQSRYTGQFIWQSNEIEFEVVE